MNLEMRIPLASYYDLVNYFGERSSLDCVPISVLLSRILSRFAALNPDRPIGHPVRPFRFFRKDEVKLVIQEGDYLAIQKHFQASEREMKDLLSDLLAGFLRLSYPRRDAIVDSLSPTSKS